MSELRVTYPNKAHDFTWLRKQALHVCACETDCEPSAVVEQAFQVFHTQRSTPDLFPGVLAVLARLREEGLILGSITNGNADLTCMPQLHSLLHFTVSSIEAGAAKPDVRPFSLAAQLAGVQLTEIVHVGDEYTADILGAKSAGMAAIWINPARTPAPSHVVADAEVAVFEDLEPAIASIRQKWTTATL
jgi:HAD superfamily hydrolase (TIGR01549 family)